MTEAEFKARVLADLAELKKDMHHLVGNGQPGRVATIEKRVEWLIIAVVILGLSVGGAYAPNLASFFIK
jgi:hypothetical protein